MAVAAKVRPSPPPPARCTMARLACTHLAKAAVDAVFFLFLASMWLLFWSVATTRIGRFSCGERCAGVTAAYNVATVAAGATLVYLLPLSVLLLALLIARSKAAMATDIEEAKEPVPETSAMRAALRDPVLLWLLGLMVFILLKLIGSRVKGDSPVMGSRQERMGSMIYDVGALGKSVMNCFLLCPIVTVWIWRAWRKARHALCVVCS